LNNRQQQQQQQQRGHLQLTSHVVVCGRSTQLGVVGGRAGSLSNSPAAGWPSRGHCTGRTDGRTDGRVVDMAARCHVALCAAVEVVYDARRHPPARPPAWSH